MTKPKEQDYNPEGCNCKIMIGGSGRLCPNCIAYNQGKAEATNNFKKFIEELKDWIDNGTNQQGKYFMSLGIDLLKKQIEKTAQEIK